jgi:hypothetical protein
MSIRPFISYAREDRPAALRLYRDLQENGAHPWLDEKDIGAGQDWRQAIKRAIAESSHFLALISVHSVNKQGFVQKEVRQALDLLETFPPGEVFVVPIRLDDSKPRHDRLADLHWLDFFVDYQEGFEKLLSSLGLEVDRPELMKPCPKCSGSGRIWVSSPNSVSARWVPGGGETLSSAICPVCRGTKIVRASIVVRDGIFGPKIQAVCSACRTLNSESATSCHNCGHRLT